MKNGSSKTYGQQIAAIAARLALRFQAREFANRTEDDVAFLKLEDYCATLPVCRNSASAKQVLMESRYADDAAWYYVESGTTSPPQGKAWTTLAAFCLSRDVQDEAIRRGWARPVELLERIENTEPTLYARRGLKPPGMPRKAARS